MQICGYADVQMCRYADGQIGPKYINFASIHLHIRISAHPRIIHTFIHDFTTALTKNKRYLQSNIITGYQISTETTMLRPY